MDKKIRIIGIIAAVIASIIIMTSPSNPVVIPQPNTGDTGTKSVQTIATNLEKPWSIGLVDNKIFFTEKVGRLRVIYTGTFVVQPLATVKVADVTYGGLL